MRYPRHILAVAGLVIASAALGTTIDAQATDHCPSGGVKTEVGNSFGPTLTLEPGTQFCVKASTYASGILTMGESGSWTTPIEWHPEGKASPDISYYVVYPGQPPVEPPPAEPPPVEPPPVQPPIVVPPVEPPPVIPEPEQEQQPLPPAEEPVVVVPEQEQLPPAAPVPAPASLPHTGTSTLLLAGLATALLGAGAGLRRLGQRS